MRILPRSKTIRVLLTLAGGALVLIQFVPVERSNPASVAPLVAPASVATVLKTSCYDCHSNATSWPWYSGIAPVSWLISHDVREGREHLNFSEWNRLSGDDIAEAYEEIEEKVREREMPLWFYVPLHPGSGLTSEEREVLLAWASQSRAAAATSSMRPATSRER